MPTPPHPKRQACLDALRGGSSVREVVEHFGVPRERVHEWAIKYGITKKKAKSGRGTHPNAAKAIQDLRRGDNPLAIATRYGLNPSTVRRWGRDRGIKIQRLPKGRGIHPKWRDADWSKTDVQLARELGVTRQRVNQARQAIGRLKEKRRGNVATED